MTTPDQKYAIKSFFDQLVGHRIEGGCEDCTAYQTVQEHGGMYVVLVLHDDTCPTLARNAHRDRA